MFVLDELDKMLESLAIRGQEEEKAPISLSDVERIDVSKLQLDSRVRYPVELPLTSSTAQAGGFMSAQTFDLDKRVTLGRKNLTFDALFLSLMNSLVVSKLTQIPERHFISAKLIFCDRYSYNSLLKLKRILSQSKFQNLGNNVGNFIYKPPYNVTAIFLLKDIIDLFDREREPIVVSRVDESSGQRAYSYNYALIRQIFPYLKMSDLIIMLKDKQHLKLGLFDLFARREHQILQFLNHFARSALVIELDSVNKLLGEPHLIYNNISIVRSVSGVLAGDTKGSKLVYSKLPLPHLPVMAERLIQLADKLRLSLKSVSYRAGDPYGQTRVFAHFLSTGTIQKYPKDNRSPARVLVLDRFYDLQSSLSHADRYGAFLEQEKSVRVLCNQITKLRMDTVDELDEMLQLNELTEVLGTILKYCISLKPKGQGTVSTTNKSLSSAMAASQSIRRHLDITKIVYKCLNEGYLMMLKLESTLESLTSQLRSLREPLPASQQDQFLQRLHRIVSAFKQLLKISGKSITSADMVRVACILIDVVNIFLYIHEKNRPATEVSDRVAGIRLSMLQGKKFKRALSSKSDAGDEFEKQSNNIIEKLVAFDKLSRETCGYRATLSLEQIIEKFCLQQLEQDSYPIVSLEKSQDQPDIRVFVLVFLGSMSPSELSKIKAYESSLKTTQQLCDIYILTCGISNPEDSLRNMQA